MIVIGVDPGTNVTGYGVIASENEVIDYGVIRTPRSAKTSEKRQLIFESVSHLVKIHQPDALSVETQFVRFNPQTAIKLGMVRGIIVLAASLAGVPVFEYSPSEAKKAVSGKGQASKAQVQGMVQLLLGLSEVPEPEDAADALALAICHIHTQNHCLQLGKEI